MLNIIAIEALYLPLAAVLSTKIGLVFSGGPTTWHTWHTKHPQSIGWRLEGGGPILTLQTHPDCTHVIGVISFILASYSARFRCCAGLYLMGGKKWDGFWLKG